MSRSGYTDDNDDQWMTIRWRGAVASAIRGKRGQAFLREMIAAPDSLPKRTLIAHELEITVHPPQGYPYRAWRSAGGIRFPDPGYTPVCDGEVG